jgi:hypothetical protein
VCVCVCVYSVSDHIPDTGLSASWCIVSLCALYFALNPNSLAPSLSLSLSLSLCCRFLSLCLLSVSVSTPSLSVYFLTCIRTSLTTLTPEPDGTSVARRSCPSRTACAFARAAPGASAVAPPVAATLAEGTTTSAGLACRPVVAVLADLAGPARERALADAGPRSLARRRAIAPPVGVAHAGCSCACANRAGCARCTELVFPAGLNVAGAAAPPPGASAHASLLVARAVSAVCVGGGGGRRGGGGAVRGRAPAIGRSKVERASTSPARHTREGLATWARPAHREVRTRRGSAPEAVGAAVAGSASEAKGADVSSHCR